MQRVSELNSFHDSPKGHQSVVLDVSNVEHARITRLNILIELSRFMGAGSSIHLVDTNGDVTIV